MKLRTSSLIALTTSLSGMMFFAGCKHSNPRPRTARIITPPPVSLSAPAAKPMPAEMPPLQTPPPAAPALSDELATEHSLNPAAAQILKMYESGVSLEVMAAHINNSPQPFQLTADQIIYFHDLGVPDGAITAMIKNDRALGHPVEAMPLEDALPAEDTAATSATGEPAPAVPTPTASPAAAAAQTIVIEERPAVTAQVFYNALSPYGSWIHLDEFGWVWQPTVAAVNAHWRPYYDRGNWVYTDAGWYWRSGYSWGWAPFHYGRWNLHAGYGWVWVPGTIWAPSWVSFRYTDAYCGWAPLPPHALYATGIGFTYHGSRVSIGFGFGLNHHHYTFVSRQHFGSHYHHRDCIDRTQTQQVFHNSTVVNNYIVGDNNTIINKGINRDRIVGGNLAEIRKVALRDVAAANQIGQNPHADNRTETISVYRPTILDGKTGPTEKQLARQETRRARPTTTPSYRNRIAIPNRNRNRIATRPNRTITSKPSRDRSASVLQSRSQTSAKPSANLSTRRSVQPPLTRPTTTPSYRNRIAIPNRNRNRIATRPNRTITSKPSRDRSASVLQSRSQTSTKPSANLSTRRSVQPPLTRPTTTPSYRNRIAIPNRNRNRIATQSSPRRTIIQAQPQRHSPPLSSRSSQPPQRASRSQKINRTSNRPAISSRSRPTPLRSSSPNAVQSTPQRSKSIPSK